MPRDLEPLGVAVAHELKNPLTAAKALVQLGLRSPAEATSHERLALVEREIVRMQEIVRRVLAASTDLAPQGAPDEERGFAASTDLASARRQGGPVRTRVALARLVSETLLALSAWARCAGVRLGARGDAVVEADRARLGEALLNLVANAIEATPPGGEVLVEVRGGAAGVEIAVRDTGRGMTPEVVRRVGTPFFTTREEGSGLGVALARAAIAAHGGELRYESAPGEGTTARATLPRDGACSTFERSAQGDRLLRGA